MTDRRARLARVPDRPDTLTRIQPLLDEARATGVIVEEIDAQHVRLLYDARVREQWLVTEKIYDLVHDHSTVEGDGQFEAAPDNWMVVHFDFASCGKSFAP